MSPEHRKVVMEAAAKVCKECTDASEQMLGQLTDALEKEGTKVTRLTPEQRAKWYEEARKPGGYFDKLRKEIGEETTDFLLKVSAEAAK
jgi:TRAP-type C4-dicarboxylate transport system substrate-binding protein